MKRRPGRLSLVGVWIAAGVVAATPDHALAQQSKDEQDLIGIEKEMCAMLVTPNPARHSQLFAEDYMGVGSRGAVASGNAAADPIQPAGNRTTSCVDQDMKVHVYGDAAVVTAVGTRAGTYHGVAYTNRRVRYTDTFVRRNGKWVCVASHTSVLVSPPKEVDWLAMERGMLQAVKAGDIVAFSAGVDPTFTGIYPTGVMGREKQIEVVRSEVLKDFNIQEFTARVLDDQTELLTYKVSTTTAERTGTYAVSSIWRWDGTAWRTILHTASPMVDGAARSGSQ